MDELQSTAKEPLTLNPPSADCPPDTALGMTINVDFTQGEVNSFAASGSPTYGDDGVSFTVRQGGDAPQLESLFYIMFGRVEVTMKAAPGAGIVSSLVLESDVLDEIDIEWLGSNPDEIQTNYFGKGQVTSYNRGAFHAVPGTQSDWITYTIDWTQDRIVWMAGGTSVRELRREDAEENQYPQTPMQVKFGSWAGGDPNHNAPGTVEWARGPTDYSQGPFSMLVQRIIITDYSTGKEYRYSDTSGSWESIEAVDGSVNGNVNNADAITVTATAESTTSTGNVAPPVGGLPEDGSEATATQTGWPWNRDARPSGGSIPEGWRMNEEGKIVPIWTGAASSMTPLHQGLLLLGPLVAGFLAFAGRLY
ncbi:licheninase [Paramyrothecium foliicola]|nr:licheninase [Paramyrothecium foliicola]